MLFSFVEQIVDQTVSTVEACRHPGAQPLHRRGIKQWVWATEAGSRGGAPVGV